MKSKTGFITIRYITLCLHFFYPTFEYFRQYRSFQCCFHSIFFPWTQRYNNLLTDRCLLLVLSKQGCKETCPYVVPCHGINLGALRLSWMPMKASYASLQTFFFPVWVIRYTINVLRPYSAQVTLRALNLTVFPIHIPSHNLNFILVSLIRETRSANEDIVKHYGFRSFKELKVTGVHRLFYSSEHGNRMVEFTDSK